MRLKHSDYRVEDFNLSYEVVEGELFSKCRKTPIPLTALTRVKIRGGEKGYWRQLWRGY